MKILTRDSWAIISAVLRCPNEAPRTIQRFLISILKSLSLLLLLSIGWVGAMAGIPYAEDDIAVSSVRLLRRLQCPSNRIEQETRARQGQRAAGRQMQHGT